MAKNVFVSYDHNDVAQKNGFMLLKNSSNHPLDFRDHSLKEPVTDRYGNPIIYPPSDPRSKPVRDEIIEKFDNASKLIVLIGQDTAESEWVDWEIKTFYNMKEELSGDNTWKRIRGMRLKGHDKANIPGALGGKSTEVMNWDPEALDKWLDRDPDK